MSDILLSGLKALDLSVNHDAVDQMMAFLRLLQQWNKSYNLTAITELDKMVSHHLLDSLAISKFLTGSRFLDVGSGAGFPGIPLAICHRDKKFVLLDSVGKKVCFLQQVKNLLKLGNIDCEQSRMQQFQSSAAFDMILCRAVGDMQTVAAATRHLLCPRGKWLFMKGLRPEAELEALSFPYLVCRLTVPALLAERHVVIVSPNSPP